MKRGAPDSKAALQIDKVQWLADGEFSTDDPGFQGLKGEIAGAVSSS